MKSQFSFLSLALLLCLAACSSIPTDVVQPTSSSLPSVSQLPTISSPQILQIFMLDADNGWATTETALIRSEDGGLTWMNATPSNLSTIGYLSSRFFLDKNKAWIMIQSPDSMTGSIFRTTDGGVHWDAFPVEFAGGFMFFSDSSNGWMLVGLGAAMSHEAVAIFQTSDGGATWTRRFTNDPTDPTSSDSIPFTGNKTGIAALDGARAWVTGVQPTSDFIYLFSTGDGGLHWTHQEPPFPPGYSGAMATTYPPVFHDPERGVFPVNLYADTTATVFYTTADGGISWTPSTPVQMLGQVSIASPDLFFVWDGGPTLFFSPDAGASWRSISSGINLAEILSSFQFIDAQVGWALSGDAEGHHSLYKSIDGGNSWINLIP